MKNQSLIKKALSLTFVLLMTAAMVDAPLWNDHSTALANSISAKEYKKTISITVPDPVMENYKEYQIPKISGYGFMEEPSVPMLPVKSFSLAVPKGAEIKNIKEIYSQKRKLKGDFNIFPVQEPVPLDNSVKPKFTAENSSIYSSSSLFPGKLFEYAGEGNLRDYGILSINVYPLQYNPAEKKLTFYENIEIEVTYVSASPLVKNEKADQDEFALMAKKIVSNPEDVDASSFAAEEKASGLLPLENADYVIITNDDFQTEFQTLADHKIARGITSEIVTLPWIAGNYSGNDNQEKIRNFIKDARASWNTKWVLLGGDTDIIPHRMAYSDFYSEYIPADLYYSDLDGNWDADGDLIYGEASDNIDLYPDMFIGRAPVGTAEEASVFVGKTIAYEQGPSGYEETALFMAEYLDGSTDGGVTKNMIESESIPANFSVTKLYASLGNLNYSNAINELNSGYGIINHIGHANYSVLSIGPNYLYRSDMDSLANLPKSSVFYSIGCWSNALDYDSIAEHFVLNPNGGGAAYIGNSRYGWYYPGYPGYGPSDRYDREFFNSLFNQKFYDIGAAFADSKADYVASSGGASVYRYLQYAINLLGDPEMTIWTTSTPQPPLLTVAAKSPEKAIINSDFTVSAKISNSGTETAIGVEALIVLPEGLSSAEPYTKSIGDIEGESSKTVSWIVAAGSLGIYNMTVSASADNAEFASGTATVEILAPDSNPPIITLLAPDNKAAVGDNEAAVFRYMPEDAESGIANCKLIINGDIWQIDYEIAENSINEFAMWFQAGAYAWKISCTDDSLETNEGFSEERTLTVEDKTPPMYGHIDIMDNKGYTNDVEPDLLATAYGANYMAFSCDNANYGGWVAYSDTIYSSFNLETGAGCGTGDGTKTVYVKFKDEAGNEGAYANDTITLDTIAPAITNITGNTSATTGELKEISLTVSDAGDVTSALIFIDNGLSGITMVESPEDTFAYNYEIPYNSIASHAYYVMVYDMAGNISRSPETGTYNITVADNDSPTANAGADQSVSAGEAVIFDASASSDNIGITGYNWNFGDGTGGYGKTVSHTYNTPGSYNVVLSVIDGAGNSGNDTLVVNVNPKIETMHISGIDMSSVKIRKSGWYVYATALVTVVDSGGNPVSGAGVSGKWSGLANDTDFGSTNGDGKIALYSNEVKSANGTFTFTVTKIEKAGWEYDYVGNAETSDSITVRK